MRLAVLLGALLLAPAADAAFTFEATYEARPLGPGRDVLVVDHAVADDCADLLARAPGAGSVPVTFTLGASSPHVLVLGPDVAHLPTEPCLAGAPESSVTVQRQYALRPDAPGLETLESTVEASLGATATAPAATAEQTVAVVGKPVFLLDLQVERKIVSSDGDRAVWRMTVVNHGNAKAIVEFRVADAPASGKVTLPDPVVLNPASSALGNGAEVEVAYQAGSGSWAQAGVTIEAVPKAFLDPSQAGEPMAQAMLARNGNAVERAAPGPALPLALLAVALAGAWRRSA